MFLHNCSIVDLTQDWKFHLGHSYDAGKDFNYGNGARLQFSKLEYKKN